MSFHVRSSIGPRCLQPAALSSNECAKSFLMTPRVSLFFRTNLLPSPLPSLHLSGTDNSDKLDSSPGGLRSPNRLGKICRTWAPGSSQGHGQRREVGRRTRLRADAFVRRGILSIPRRRRKQNAACCSPARRRNRVCQPRPSRRVDRIAASWQHQRRRQRCFSESGSGLGEAGAGGWPSRATVCSRRFRRVWRRWRRGGQFRNGTKSQEKHEGANEKTAVANDVRGAAGGSDFTTPFSGYVLLRSVSGAKTCLCLIPALVLETQNARLSVGTRTTAAGTRCPFRFLQSTDHVRSAGNLLSLSPSLCLLLVLRALCLDGLLLTLALLPRPEIRCFFPRQGTCNITPSFR